MSKFKYIVSTNGYRIKVDTECYSRLSKYSWWAHVLTWLLEALRLREKREP